MQKEVSVAIAGSGGAGVMTAGELLLATAAACGLFGLMTRSYGPQIRGGESVCFLRLGTGPFYKQADGVDVLAVLDFRNFDRFQEELALNPGAWVIYDQAEEAPRLNAFRQANLRPLPCKLLLNRIEGGKGRLNILMLGMLCRMLGFREAEARKILSEWFPQTDRQVARGNAEVFTAGWGLAAEQWGAPPFQLPDDRTGEPRWVLTGNQGIVAGSLAAGCEFFAGYPITPATDIMEALGHYLPLRGGVSVQAEDELAAVNMAIGASYGGKKAMTATSGPGFSLMAEGLGLAVMAEIPLVVVDVQRVGPSTGIPTKTEQSDLWAALASSHGDNPRVVLAPSSARECIDLTAQAFAIAESYQAPVILISDQFLGGRSEIVPPVVLESVPVTRRRASDTGTSPYWRFGGMEEGVAAMAVPGMAGGEYTADGLEHDARGWPATAHGTHQAQSERRLAKLGPLAAEERWIEVCGDPAANTGLIGWGSTGGVVKEAVQVAQARGLPIKGLIPHLLFPPQAESLNRHLEALDRLFVAELSSMKQFYHYLRAFYRLPARTVSIARAGGLPFRTAEVLAAMKQD